MRNLLDTASIAQSLDGERLMGSLPFPKQRLVLGPADYKDPAQSGQRSIGSRKFHSRAGLTLFRQRHDASQGHAFSLIGKNAGLQFVRLVKLDFRKLNLILVEAVGFACHIPLSGKADPRPSQNGSPFKFCSTLKVAGSRGLSTWMEL
jgi:hypothetical protein